MGSPAEHRQSWIFVQTCWESSLEEGDHGVSQDSATRLLPRKQEEVGGESFWVLGAVPCPCHSPAPRRSASPAVPLGGSKLFPARAPGTTPQGWWSGALRMQRGTLNPLLGLPCLSSAQWKAGFTFPVLWNGQIFPSIAPGEAPKCRAGGSGWIPVGRSSSSSREGLKEASKSKAGFDGRPGWCPKFPTWTQNGKEEVRSHLEWAGQEGWARDVTQSFL